MEQECPEGDDIEGGTEGGRGKTRVMAAESLEMRIERNLLGFLSALCGTLGEGGTASRPVPTSR